MRHFTESSTPLFLDYDFLKSLPERREFHRFGREYLNQHHGLSQKGLQRLHGRDENAALNVIQELHGFRIRKYENRYLYLNPQQYKDCPEAEKPLWKPFFFKPKHLMQRRGVESSEAYGKLFNQFQEAYQPDSDRFLSILVELGKLSDMGKIRSIAKEIAGSSLSYCKVERPAHSKEQKHHLHILMLETPQTVIPDTVGGHKVQIRPLGEGKYADEPMLSNLHTFLLYLHKPYDARIFARGNNKKNLHRLLLEDFLGFEVSAIRQRKSIRRWSINLNN